MDKLIEKTCAIFGVHRSQLIGASQLRHVVHARQALALAISLKEPSYSMATIGTIIKRDHYTVKYSIDQAEIRRKNDRIFAQRFEQLVKEDESPAGDTAHTIGPLGRMLERRDPVVSQFLTECNI